MAELKTRATSKSVAAFIKAVPDEQMRKDCAALAVLMEKVTGEKPRMWGLSIIGFGSYRYTYASGHSGEAALTGFAPRKKDLVLYVMPGFEEREALVAALGPCKTGKACIYVKRLDDLHQPTLKKLVAAGVRHLKRTYPDK